MLAHPPVATVSWDTDRLDVSAIGNDNQVIYKF